MPRKNGNSNKANDAALLRFCERHSADHAALHEAIAEQRAHMEGLREDIHSLKPHRGDRWVFWTLVFTIFTAVVGSVWFLSERITERPTVSDVQNITQPLEKEVKDMQTEHAEQKVLLNQLKDSMDDIKQDLKELKSR